MPVVYCQKQDGAYSSHARITSSTELTSLGQRVIWFTFMFSFYVKTLAANSHVRKCSVQKLHHKTLLETDVYGWRTVLLARNYVRFLPPEF